jgi:exopolysaccharide biosynthesis protein
VSDNRYDGRGGRGPVRGNRYARPPQQHRRPQGGGRVKPVWFLVIVDLLVLGVALNLFALGNSSLFNPATGGEDIPQPSVIATLIPTPSPKPTAVPTEATASGTPATATPEPTQALDTSGMFGAQFADKFATGDPEITDTTYKSRNISITINKEVNNGIEFIWADIYVRNKDNFQAFFKDDKFGGIDSTLNQAKARNAILAISGDNAANRPNKLGYEIRNGKKYHASAWQDVLAMYNDGSIKTFSKAAFETEYKAIKDGTVGNGGIWQVWTFGPMLLDASGQPMTKFAPDSITSANNERTALGYFEPGHYCFVTTASTDENVRAGMSLADLSQKMCDLGCKAAYNLDGGQSSAMVFNGKYVNTLYHGGRSITDIVAIGEYVP